MLFTPVLFTCFFACTEKTTDTAIVDNYSAPDSIGPFTAGTISENFTHSYGFNVPVQVWYPSTQTTGEVHKYDDIKAGTALQSIPVDCSTEHPVVLFSHGNQGLRYQSYFLTEYLASHGYVVVAPRHVGNSFMDYDADRMSEVVFRRPLDIQESFDWLLEQPQFMDCVEQDAYTIIGHSFGGYTTLALLGGSLDTEESLQFCASYPDAWLCDEIAQFVEENGNQVVNFGDDRAKRGISLAPAGYEALLHALPNLTEPIVVLGGSTDDMTTMQYSVKPIYQAIASEDKWLGELANANHYSFTNACEILPTDTYCNPNGMPAEEAYHLINTVSTAFLGWQTSNDTRYLDHFPLEAENLTWYP